MTQSLWRATGVEPRFPALAGDAHADVAVIGGGITGITTAALLAKAGMSVIVLEADRLATGTTGNSTGNLYATLDWDLHALEEKWDRDTMQAVAHSRQDAVDLIELLTHSYDIECDFARVPFCLYAERASRDERDRLEQEYRAAINADLNARLVDSLPLPFPIGRALVIEGQAQFHPLNFVRGLAERIASPSCRLFENTQVIDVDDEHGLVRTDHGHVRAKHIVMATHTPKGVYAVHMAMKVYQEHGIALRLADGACPPGIFWSTDTTRSLRNAPGVNQSFLVVVGEKHELGEDTDAETHLDALEDYARKRFSVLSRHYAWTGQHYRSADGLPYIGRSPGSERTHIATGFATDGLTYGALAAMIISEDIFGRESKWSDLYDVRRFTPAKSAPGVAAENTSVAGHLLRHLLHRYPDRLEAVRPGRGEVLEIEGQRLAVYRDEANRFALVSAHCTHMGCLLHWNSLERSWDCPCHGSRFTVEGEIIEGPALATLERYHAPPK